MWEETVCPRWRSELSECFLVFVLFTFIFNVKTDEEVITFCFSHVLLATAISMQLYVARVS